MAAFPCCHCPEIRSYNGDCWVKGCALFLLYKSPGYFFCQRGYKNLTLTCVREGAGPSGSRDRENTCWRLCPHSQQLLLGEDGWCGNCIGDSEGHAVKGPLQPPTCHQVGGGRAGPAQQVPEDDAEFVTVNCCSESLDPFKYAATNSSSVCI